MNLYDLLIQTSKSKNYPQEKFCHSFSLKTVEAVLADDFSTFRARIANLQKTAHLSKRLFNTHNNHHLIDYQITNFIDNCYAYNHPDRLSDLFGEHYTKNDYLAISRLIGNDRVVAQGGLIDVFSRVNCFSSKEISTYLSLLGNLVEARVNTDCSIPFLICTPTHKNVVIYTTQRGSACWQYVDINDYRTQYFDAEDIAPRLYETLVFGENLSNLVSFNIQCILTERHPYAETLKDALSILPQFCLTENMTHIEGYNLPKVLYLAVLYREPSIINECLDYNAGLLTRPTGSTKQKWSPLELAAFLGRTEVITQFFAACTHQNIVPTQDILQSAVIKAILRNHVTTVAALLPHVETNFMCSITLSRLPAQNNRKIIYHQLLTQQSRGDLITPFTLAWLLGHRHIIDLLTSKKKISEVTNSLCSSNNPSIACTPLIENFLKLTNADQWIFFNILQLFPCADSFSLLLGKFVDRATRNQAVNLIRETEDNRLSIVEAKLSKLTAINLLTVCELLKSCIGSDNRKLYLPIQSYFQNRLKSESNEQEQYKIECVLLSIDALLNPANDAVMLPVEYQHYKSLIHVNLYQVILPLAKLAYYDENNGLPVEHAVKLSIVFKGLPSLLQYLTEFTHFNSLNQFSLHDVCLFTLPPLNINTQFWYSLTNKNKFMLNPQNRMLLSFAAEVESVHRLFSEKSHSELPLHEVQETFRDAQKRFNTKLKERQNNSIATELFNYLNVSRYELALHSSQKPVNTLTLEELFNFYELYKVSNSGFELFNQYGINRAEQNEFIKLIPAANDRLIPNVYVDGKEIGLKGYFLVLLDVKSLLGAIIAAILGKITGCCQSIGGAGESCATHGITSEYGGFYVLYKGDELTRTPEPSSIIAQSWAWHSNLAICLDSLEAIDLNPDVYAMYYLLANKIYQTTHIKQINFHSTFSPPKPFIPYKAQKETLLTLEGYDSYSDAKTFQRVIFDQHGPNISFLINLFFFEQLPDRIYRTIGIIVSNQLDDTTEQYKIDELHTALTEHNISKFLQKTIENSTQFRNSIDAFLIHMASDREYFVLFLNEFFKISLLPTASNQTFYFLRELLNIFFTKHKVRIEVSVFDTLTFIERINFFTTILKQSDSFLKMKISFLNFFFEMSSHALTYFQHLMHVKPEASVSLVELFLKNKNHEVATFYTQELFTFWPAHQEIIQNIFSTSAPEVIENFERIIINLEEDYLSKFPFPKMYLTIRELLSPKNKASFKSKFEKISSRRFDKIIIDNNNPESIELVTHYLHNMFSDEQIDNLRCIYLLQYIEQSQQYELINKILKFSQSFFEKMSLNSISLVSRLMDKKQISDFEAIILKLTAPFYYRITNNIEDWQTFLKLFSIKTRHLIFNKIKSINLSFNFNPLFYWQILGLWSLSPELTIYTLSHNHFTNNVYNDLNFLDEVNNLDQKSALLDLVLNLSLDFYPDCDIEYFQKLSLMLNNDQKYKLASIILQLPPSYFNNINEYSDFYWICGLIGNENQVAFGAILVKAYSVNIALRKANIEPIIANFQSFPEVSRQLLNTINYNKLSIEENLALVIAIGNNYKHCENIIYQLLEKFYFYPQLADIVDDPIMLLNDYINYQTTHNININYNLIINFVSSYILKCALEKKSIRPLLNIPLILSQRILESIDFKKLGELSDSVVDELTAYFLPASTKDTSFIPSEFTANLPLHSANFFNKFIEHYHFSYKAVQLLFITNESTMSNAITLDNKITLLTVLLEKSDIDLLKKLGNWFGQDEDFLSRDDYLAEFKYIQLILPYLPDKNNVKANKKCYQLVRKMDTYHLKKFLDAEPSQQFLSRIVDHFKLQERLAFFKLLVDKKLFDLLLGWLKKNFQIFSPMTDEHQQLLDLIERALPQQLQLQVNYISSRFGSQSCKDVISIFDYKKLTSPPSIISGNLDLAEINLQELIDYQFYTVDQLLTIYQSFQSALSSADKIRFCNYLFKNNFCSLVDLKLGSTLLIACQHTSPSAEVITFAEAILESRQLTDDEKLGAFNLYTNTPPKRIVRQFGLYRKPTQTNSSCIRNDKLLAIIANRENFKEQEKHDEFITLLNKKGVLDKGMSISAPFIR